MIITRTPFRISFFGGGTDYPAWYRDNGGAVLSTTIDKYCHIHIRYLPPFFEHKHRIVYSIIETVQAIEEIKHPVVRAVLDYFKVEPGVEIHHDGDLPARSGLGSSSAFTVGLLNALYALRGEIISRSNLAKLSIHIEREILKENVGSQDQVAVTYGGFNKISFEPDHSFRVDPVILKPERLADLHRHLLLVYTGVSHFSSEIAGDQIKNIPANKNNLLLIQQMVDQAVNILAGQGKLVEFGRLMHEAWQIKKQLSNNISTPKIDDLYAEAISSGATGGKLLGAGGGGFILLFVAPEHQAKVRAALKNLLMISFNFEKNGSQIIHYDLSRVTNG